MDELARLLSVERRLLELLLFRLVVQRHLLAAGEVRFLVRAAAEAERARERVQDAGLLRSMLVAELADTGRFPDEGLTLRALARDSDQPLRRIFADHLLALVDLAAEIEELAGRAMPALDDFLGRQGRSGPAASSSSHRR